MILLTSPGSKFETNDIPVDTVAYFRPLGLLGIGPLFEQRTEGSKEGASWPGRKLTIPVEIDFEDADAREVCLVRYRDSYRKTREIVLEFAGAKFSLYGLIPLECVRDNVWRCHYDAYKGPSWLV
jgi:hypothetical protein